MSRNLCTSSCPHCGYTLRLSDLKDRPIEFRRYGHYAPQLGCRFDCSCGVAYFAIWRRQDSYWGREALDSGAWKASEFITPDGRAFPNRNAGRFVIERPAFSSFPAHVEDTGVFIIDLSYYETYNDEECWDEDEKAAILVGDRPPWHLCTDNAEDVQLLWGEGNVK